jgi:hypothetical protein
MTEIQCRLTRQQNNRNVCCVTVLRGIVPKLVTSLRCSLVRFLPILCLLPPVISYHNGGTLTKVPSDSRRMCSSSWSMQLFEAQIRTYFKTERLFLTEYTCVIITNTNKLMLLREITAPDDEQSPTIDFKYMSLLILTTK